MPRRALLAAATALCAASTPALAQDDALAEGRTGTVESRDSAFLQAVAGTEVQTPDGTVVGTVAETLIDAQGRPAGYVLAIDGFLGIFDRDVQVPVSSLTWDESHYVTKMTEAQLENLAPWDE